MAEYIAKLLSQQKYVSHNHQDVHPSCIEIRTQFSHIGRDFVRRENGKNTNTHESNKSLIYKTNQQLHSNLLIVYLKKVHGVSTPHKNHLMCSCCCHRRCVYTAKIVALACVLV